MRLLRLTLLGLVVAAALLSHGAHGEEEDDVAEEEELYTGVGSAGGEDLEVERGAAGEDEGERDPSAVYVMEHGFLVGDTSNWLPRGTLLLSGSPGRGGLEARLSDAKEFVQLRPELQQLMSQAASKGQYYAIRMYSPTSPKRALQAAIPAKLLADHFEDWHDILEVTVGATGVPVGLSYRVRHTLGLALFDHTQVHLSESSRTEGPRVAPSSRDGGAGPGSDKQQGSQSFLRRYWWVIIIVLLLLSSAGDDGSGSKQAAGGGGGGGGGGGRRAS